MSMGKAAVILSTILLNSMPSYVELTGRSNNPNSAAVLGTKGPVDDVALVFGEFPRISPLCGCIKGFRQGGDTPGVNEYCAG